MIFCSTLIFLIFHFVVGYVPEKPTFPAGFQANVMVQQSSRGTTPIFAR